MEMWTCNCGVENSIVNTHCQYCKTPRGNKRLDDIDKQAKKFVSLPAGVTTSMVTDAEFETASRIFSRWMIEHPEVTELVLIRSGEKE